MDFIYSRVSTDDQTVKNQLHKLRELYPHATVVEETTSGFYDKPALNALIARLQKDDLLIVAALDRLGRKASAALKLVEELTEKGVRIHSLREHFDTKTASGKFMATVMFGFAEMERQVISDRTKAGMAARKAAALARGETWKCGRGRTYSDEIWQQIKDLRSQGFTFEQISERTGVSLSQAYKILKKMEKAA